MGIFSRLRQLFKYNDNLISLREMHYTKFLGSLVERIIHSTDKQDVHIDIYQFKPNDKRPYWTLITGGMSDLPQHIPDDIEGISPRAEIIMYAKEPQDWMLIALKDIAEMPFKNKTFLHWHHTISNGQPVDKELDELTSYFFLPPYFEQPEFDKLYIDKDKVDILWLLPITERERECAIENGGQVLEEAFIKAELNILVDEKRNSLI